MLLNLLLCLIGLIFLTLAADKLVESASNLALNMGVSKMAIGLTIVAAGTSLPELVVSINASLKGNAGISLGNVVGSNIFNASLILGISALIYPIACEKQMVKRETPIMITVAALLWFFASTGSFITPVEGLALFSLFIAYTVMSYFIGRRESAIAEELKTEAEKIIEENDAKSKPTTMQNLLSIFIGLVGLVAGAEALMRGSVAIAQSLGISDEIIGLTLIAAGTSLPELATSIMAARKGQSDISLGNIVGSNIFNVLGIVGVSASLPMFLPGATESSYLAVSSSMLGIHIPIMMVVSLGVLPIMWTGMRIVRLEGAVLVAAYIAYSVMLYQTSGAEAQPAQPLPAKTTTSAPANGNSQPALPITTGQSAVPNSAATAPAASATALSASENETTPSLQIPAGSEAAGITAPEVIPASGTNP